MDEEMLNQAREYLARRLDSEQSYSTNLYALLAEAVEEICSIVRRYGITETQLMSDTIPDKARREIDNVIAELAAEIADMVFILSQDDRDDNAWFIAFLKREFSDGWNFDDRLRQYTKNFGNQVLMGIAALSILGVAYSEWSKSIAGNIRDIYNSPFVRAVRKQNLSYFSPMKLGRGVPHNMAIGLEFLGKQEIANAWMEYEYEESKKNGAKGYNIYRGSSYPCPECDDNVGWHDISEEFPIPVHSHCYCFAVYVYV